MDTLCPQKWACHVGPGQAGSLDGVGAAGALRSDLALLTWGASCPDGGEGGTRSLCAPNACVSPSALHTQVHSLNLILPAPASEWACAAPADQPGQWPPSPRSPPPACTHHQQVPRLQQPLSQRHCLKVTVTSQGRSSCCSSGPCAGSGLVRVWTSISRSSRLWSALRSPPPRGWGPLLSQRPRSCCRGLCVLMTPRLFLHSAAGGTPPAPYSLSGSRVWDGTPAQPPPHWPQHPFLFLSFIPPPGGPVREAPWTCCCGDHRQPSQRLSPEQLPELEALWSPVSLLHTWPGQAPWLRARRLPGALE